MKKCGANHREDMRHSRLKTPFSKHAASNEKETICFGKKDEKQSPSYQLLLTEGEDKHRLKEDHALCASTH